MLTKLIVITLQYIQILIHYVEHLKLIQYYMPIILQFFLKDDFSFPCSVVGYAIN